MRYVLAMILALGIGVSTVVPAAFAGGEEGGREPSFPATTIVQTEPSYPGNPGTVAGPEAPDHMAPNQVVNEHETDRN